MSLATPNQLKTFADLYAAVREELKIQSTDTTSIQRIQRDLNIVYIDEVVPFANWRWLRGNINLNLYAAFTSGTASVQQNSATVTLTIAPASSRKNYYFSVVGYNEIYRIQAHAANATTIYLEAPYTGGTNTAASFKIWTDEIPLPSFVRETFNLTHDFQDNPLENCGLQKFRQYVAALPKAEGRPMFYTCESYTDPGQYTAISGLPALSTRASDTLNKTLVFVADVSNYLAPGDRIRISTAGDATYNGDYVVSTVSTTTVTYTGIYPLAESAAADSGLSVQKAYSSANDRRYKRLLVYPAINNINQMLHCDYLREVVPMLNDTDEPLMPIGDRSVLLYGALHRAWSRERNPEEAARNKGLYDQKLARMAGKVDDSLETPRLQINRVWLGAKRANNRHRNNSFPTGWGSGGSSASNAVPVNTANRAAIFDTSGNLNASVVKTSELNELSGIQSAAVGITDTQTLQNKTIVANNSTVADGTTATKQFGWSLSAATAATKTTFAFIQTANRTLTFPDITDTVITLTYSGTLTNKSLDDSTTKVVNTADATKALSFSLGGATTGKTLTLAFAQTNNRTVTFADPGGNDSVVYVAATQTLTNKSVGDPADNTKALTWSLSGATTGKVTTLSFSQTNNRTISFPDVTDTVVTLAAAQTLTNKTLTAPVISTISNTGTLTLPTSTDTLVARTTTDTLTNKTFGDAITLTQITTPASPSAGKDKLYFKNDNNLYTLTSGGLEQKVGTAFGTKNYLSAYNGNTGNGDFELNATTGWSLFSTTFTSGIPTGTINASGGSFSNSIISSGQIGGKYSLKSLSGATGVTAGDGFISDAFTIDLEDQAKVMQISFFYSNQSGTSFTFSGTSSNTWAVYVYDVTNSAWIQPAGVYNLVQGSGVGYCTATFQTTSNSTQYRLAVLCITSTAATPSLAVFWDDFFVGPQHAPMGPAMSDPTSYTPTVTGSPSLSVNTAQQWRNGKFLFVEGQLTTNAAASGSTLTVSIPAGLSIDTTALSNGGVTNTLGVIRQFSAGVAHNVGVVSYQSATTVDFFITGASSFLAGSGIGASGSGLFYEFKVPISGWSSNTVSSADTDTRIVAAMYQSTTGTTTGSNGTILNFDTKVIDTHAAVTTGASPNWKFTAPVSGNYRVSHIWESQAAASAAVGKFLGFDLYKNGINQFSLSKHISQTTTSAKRCGSGSATIALNAGDYIQIGVDTDDGTVYTMATSALLNCISIERLSGPAIVTATESVYARASSSSTSVANGTTTVLVFGTVDFDTHGAYANGTGIYTVPVSGCYECSCYFEASAATGQGAINNAETLRLQKNGSDFAFCGSFVAQQTGTAMTRKLHGTAIVKCITGDTLKFAINNPDSTFAGANSSTQTWVSFKRIGN